MQNISLQYDFNDGKYSFFEKPHTILHTDLTRLMVSHLLKSVEPSDFLKNCLGLLPAAHC